MHKIRTYIVFLIFQVSSVCISLSVIAKPQIVQNYEGSVLPKGFLISPHVKELYGREFNNSLLGAWNQSSVAIDEVISEKWKSSSQVPILLGRDEFDEVDVSYCSWKKNGTNVLVVQTRTLMTITITPIGNTETNKSIDTILAETRDLCGDFFVEKGYRLSSSQMDEVPIEGLSGKIASYLFDSGFVYVTTNQTGVCLYGRGLTPEEALPGYPEDYETEDMVRFDQLAGDEWFGTPHAWGYWFRRIYWWNDGKKICFFFPKCHNGPGLLRGSRAHDREFMNGKSVTISNQGMDPTSANAQSSSQ